MQTILSVCEVKVKVALYKYRGRGGFSSREVSGADKFHEEECAVAFSPSRRRVVLVV